MQNKDVVLLCATLLLRQNLIQSRSAHNKRKRRWWVRPINRNRQKEGEYNRLFLEMKMHDKEWFFTYTRMSPSRFDMLLSLVGQKLQKHSQRRPLQPGQRLAMTLRYLATGDGTFSIATSYRVGRSTVSTVVRETMAALWVVLSPIYLNPPTEEEFVQVANGFWTKWNMPNCCGSVDGKHIRIEAPATSGSLYFNYKKYFSIILLGICDASYNFLFVDIGNYGSQSDGGVFCNSNVGEMITNNEINFPKRKQLPGTNHPKYNLPHFIVGDAAFPLREEIMRPFPGKNLNLVQSVFNYRHSRARRTIENTFGILQARWRIFCRTICAEPETVDSIVQACVSLHNFIKLEDAKNCSENLYCPPNYVDNETSVGQWRHEISQSIFDNCNRLGSNNSSVRARAYQNYLSHYFLTPAGYKEGQIEYVQRTE